MSSLRSPAATAPLDDEDLLTEILLRLPPQPSSLPRASLVCHRWRGLVSDPRFVRRFRRRHSRNRPLVGFFDMCPDRNLYFVPTLEAPNRVPPERLALQFDDSDQFMPLGSRHGLVFVIHLSRNGVLVWDPVTADQHLIAFPPGLAGYLNRKIFHGAALRAPGEIQHFQVVLIVADDDDHQYRHALACVYSSKTGAWGDVISAPLPAKVHMRSLHLMVCPFKGAVLIDNSLYWMLVGNFIGILEFDLLKQSIAVIPIPPVDVFSPYGRREFTVVRAMGGGLGFLIAVGFCAQLWKRRNDCHGVASWVLERTIELDKLLPLNSEESAHLFIVGFAEENNVVFLWITLSGLFLIDLESLQFKKIPSPSMLACYLPFESVFVAETCVSGGNDGAVGGGHDGVEILLNTSTC